MNDYQHITNEELIEELKELRHKYDSLEILYHKEIDERKQIENALQFKNALLEAQANASLDGILLFNGDNKLLLVNYRFRDLLNVPPHILEDKEGLLLFPYVISLSKYPEEFAERAMYLNDRNNEASIDEIEFKSGMILERYSAPVLDKEGKNYGRIWIFHDITDRKRAEAELISAKEKAEENETKFRAIFENSKDAIGITKKGINILFNGALMKMFGYNDESELTGRPVLEQISPKEHAKIINYVQKRYTEKDLPNFYESIGIRKNGTEFPFEVKVGTYSFNNEFFTIAIFRDITERKLAEEALRESQVKYRAMIEQSNDGITIADLDGSYIMVNPAYCRMTGYSDEELLRMKITDLVGKQTTLNLFITVATKNESGYRELELVRKDGTTFVALITGSSIEFGGKRYVQGIVRDVTERKLAETELVKAKEKVEESEVKFRAAFLTSPDSVNINTWDGEYIEINEGFTQLTGYTREDVIGIKSLDLNMWTNPEDRETLLRALKEKGIIENLESVFRCKDGTCKTALMSARVLRIKNMPHILSVTRDITLRKKLENDLILAKEQAETSDHLKTAFLQNMSHEIRTPMNAIMGFSKLIGRNYNNKPKLEKFSEIINQRCNDLLDIINDILDIAKIESGQLSVNEEECNLNILFSELTVFFTEHQKRIEKQQIRLSLQTLCMESDNIIVTDKIKLKQIFINLISNAFKFTDTGSINGGCKLDDNHNLIFYVSDTGIGISADKHEKIFERFTQLDQGFTRLYGGTGLGLSIVKGLVNLLRGKIWLESEPGKGSTFFFSFPCKIKEQVTDKILMKEDVLEFQFSGKTILIVEDDKYNIEFLTEILSDTGANILCAESGRDAIQIAASQTLDLILMDIRLPDMDGYNVASEIRKYNPHLKMIAQTAYAAPEDKQRALEGGFIDYISKPLDYEMLLSILNKNLSGN